MNYVEEKHPKLGRIIRLNSEEEQTFVLAKVIEIAKSYGLEAELFPKSVMSRGVQGDEGTYTRVVNLKGTFKNYGLLGKISTEISNAVPINKVVFQICPETL